MTDTKHETKQNASHTPGPWRHSGIGVTIADHMRVEIHHRWDERKTAEQVANARLIAASPKLLSAGEAVLANWERGDLAAAVRDLASAIAEAKGLAA